jgi:hypothetical protein
LSYAASVRAQGARSYAPEYPVRRWLSFRGRRRYFGA